MNNERRTAPRISFKTSASIYYGDSNVARAALETRDISLAGVYLQTESKIPAGTECCLDIHLEGDSSTMHFTVQGTVCRHEGEGLAVSFKKLNPDGYAHIKNLMNIHADEQR